MSSNNKD